MEKTRILPPLVRGRVTGVLDFFVDEIRLFRNILLLSDNYDLVLQVQWWGEVLPAIIRPKELKVPGRTKRNSHVLESYYHSAQYEIKTTLDLFKTYLKHCEVLELSVLEAFENYVIGSAFLKDLINVLFNNNELVKMPIFDYLGDEIGEVIIHVNFLQKPYQEKDNHLNKALDIFKNNSGGKTSDNQDCNISNKINPNYLSLAEKTIFYDGHSKRTPYKGEPYIESGLSWLSFNKNKETTNSNKSSSVTEESNTLLNRPESKISNKILDGGEESTCTCLPEIQTVSDSSKVLYFGVSSQHHKPKTPLKKPSTKITNKFNSNSIKYKSKHPGKLGIVSLDKSKKSSTKKTDINSSAKYSSKIDKGKYFNLKLSSAPNEFENSKILPSNGLGDIRNIPSKQSPNIKVLDYLLGSDMTKEDEESALNDLKIMSPSHNLVRSISQLCLISDNNSQKSIQKHSTNSSVSLKRTFLNFDFTNPIERNYYEKFFLKSNVQADFEIAEFINQPENSDMVDKLKFDVTTQQKNESHTTDLEDVSKFSYPGAEAKESSGEDCLVSIDVPDRKNGCARCKYYKKLNELDAIIDSLKHFEQKLLLHEKELQSTSKENSGILTRKKSLKGNY